MIVPSAVLMILWCGLVAAQTTSITGTVTSILDSTPIARAKVTISGGPSTQAVLTDRSGSFTFGGVPAGTYSLTAERVGFLLPEAQGQQSQPAATVSVTVEADKKPDAVSLHLSPCAVITGTVTDENGFPFPSPRLTFVRRTVEDGRERLTSKIDATGNDLGEFRTLGLAPGSYLVCLDAIGSSYQSHHHLAYARTCFPNATDPSSAQWVKVGPGEERNLGFQITPMHAIQVSGSVDTGGKKLLYMSIKRTHSAGFPQSTNLTVEWDEKTATFRVSALVPGDYLITASDGESQGLRAMRTIHADAEDIRDLRLTLREAVYVSGSVQMENTPSMPDGDVRAFYHDDEDVISIFAQSTGSFRVDNLDAGEYAINVLSPGLYVKSITQGGADIRDSKIVVGTDVSPDPIEIVLARVSDGSTEVSPPTKPERE